MKSFSEKKSIELIRAYGRGWWYHRKLREQNKHIEARKKEIESARDVIRRIREGVFLSHGPHGYSLYLAATRGGTSKIQGYHPDGDRMEELLRRFRPDIPVVDSRPMESKPWFIRWVLSGPMPNVYEDFQASDSPSDKLKRWHGFNMIPVGDYMEIARACGARVVGEMPIKYIKATKATIKHLKEENV